MEDISRITGIEDAQNYRAGQVIFEEGERGECMYLVLRGEIEVSVQGRPIDVLGPGTIFGEMALVDEGPRSATVTAKTDSRLVPIDQSRFSKLVRQSPEFAIQVMGTMSVRLRRLLEEEVQRQRMEEELKIGREIQLSLLPKDVPVVPGWEFASFYRAAREVGGDLYDFIKMPNDENRLAVVIADVTGKGVPAALFMASGRTAIRTEVINGKSPAAALRRTNQMILMDAQSPLLMSAFLATFQLNDGRVTYACAGHDRPLWLDDSNKRITLVEGRGIVLGVFHDIILEEKEIELNPGDFLIFYTDGVTEARRADCEFFELARLEKCISAARCGSAREMVEIIVNAVGAFTGDTPQGDDLTLVVARKL